MRIGIDARFYGSLGKGLGRYTEKLIQALERLPGDDQFIIFLRQENFEEYQPSHARFHKVLADYPWYGWQEQWRFPWLLYKHKLDLVHFPHFNVPLLYLKKNVVTIHDLILFHYPTVKASELPPLLYWAKYVLYRLVIRLAVCRAAQVMTVSRFTASDLAREFPQAAKKILVTYEAADKSCYWMSPALAKEWLRSLGLAPGSYVLYVGNAYPHKHLECLLEVAQEMPDKQFVCVGREDYFYRRLHKLVADSRITNVRFIGFVPDYRLSVLYREAVCYFFPSLYEGFGLPGLEAFSHGLPVVAARAGALPEILGSAAVYFEPREGHSAARLLKKLETDLQFRSEYIKRGYAQVDLFSWGEMASLTLEAYHREV